MHQNKTTRRTTRSAWGAILILLTLAAMTLACGPVAQPGETGPNNSTASVPLPQEDPKPSEQSGDDPDDKPNPTPKPTIPVREPKPDDGSGPTPTLEPEYPPPPTVGPTETPPPMRGEPEPLPQAIPHPDGLAGCRQMSPFVLTDPANFSGNLDWCVEELATATVAECQGAGSGSSEDERACANDFLADVTGYYLREVNTPCHAVSDKTDQLKCFGDTTRGFNHHTTSFFQVYNEILDAVHDNAAVKEVSKALHECVAEAGHDAPDAAKPLDCQEIDHRRRPSKADRMPLTEAEEQANRQRYRDMNKCAQDSGVYEVQEAAWLSEIARIQGESPERLIPFKAEGFVAMLEEDGPASFLTIIVAPE